jgi:hypothetical protein
MEQLKKMYLKERADLLNDQEMKLVVGGYDESGWCCFNDGECVPTGCTSGSQCTGWYGEGWCEAM